MSISSQSAWVSPLLDIQPILTLFPSQGAFGLVWWVFLCLMQLTWPFNPSPQLREGSAHRSLCGDKEDHEALQHTRSKQENLPRTQTPQTHPT